EDVGDLALHVQRTVWHEINLERTSSRLSSGESELMVVSAERLDPGRRVVLEYVVADRLGLTPWVTVFFPRGEPVARLTVRSTQDALAGGLRVQLVTPPGMTLPAAVRQESDGTVVAEAVPARDRIGPLRALFQPAEDQLFPFVLAWIDPGAGASMAGYASFYRGKWNERLAAIDAAQVKALAAKVVGDTAAPADRAARLATFVQQEIQYDASNEGSADAWLPLASEEVLRSRRGDCKGKVMLLQAFLAAVGIESAPVLLRWDSDHFVWGVTPGSAFFNHVILAVKLPAQKPPPGATLVEGPAQGWVLVDPTVTTAAFGAPLPGHEGLPALLIGEAAEPVFTIRTATPSVASLRTELDFELDAGGVCRGELRATDNGHAPLLARLGGRLTDQEVADALRDLLVQQLPQVKVREHEVVRASAQQPATRLRVSFEAPGCAQELSDSVLVPSPPGVVATLAGLPRGLRPATPVKPEDAVTLDAPWSTRLNTTGLSTAIEAAITLRLPPGLVWAPSRARRDEHAWLVGTVTWEVAGDREYRGTLRIVETRGTYPPAERKARLQLVDELYSSLYTPLMLARVAKP
ncbi:MAG: transglutaminase-like domain-containing protein, partial [Thermoanaerobaculaceae bacterium]|nr:transglutaminase-like domain-containing protein [Thermoanaerobaculaceae bacterium]